MSDEKTYTCPNCREAELKRVWSKKKERYFWACQNATEICGKYFSDRDGEPIKPVTKSDPDPNVLCPDCAAPTQKVVGAAHGDFYSCSKYPECKATVDLMPDGTFPPACPSDPEHGPMRRRTGKNGPFLSCRRYPECDATQELTCVKKSKTA